MENLSQSYAKSSVSNKATSSTALENVYRSLGQRLDEYPESRCNSQQRCVDLVKGGNSFYVSVIIKDGFICFLKVYFDFYYILKYSLKLICRSPEQLLLI